MLMNRIRILLAVALAAGCGMSSGTTLPSEAPSIEGTIQQSSATQAGRRILVEATAPVAGRESAAYITVLPGAVVLAGSAETVVRASADELVVGARVRVWFTGPVAESFPVQATAGTVLILR
jgi:hypothetical protein